MAEDNDRPEPARGEAVESNGYIPHGFALDYVLKARPDMGKEAARALLFELCRTEKVRVRSGQSATRSTRQAKVEILRAHSSALEASLWNRVDLEREVPMEPAAKSKAGRKPEYFWDEFAVCFGALLYDQRSGKGPEEQIIKIQEIAQSLNIKKIPDRATIQTYRDRWLAAYTKWKKKDDAGN